MSKYYLSIQEASELAKKSIQTIRRAIKAKKLHVKKQKTPQGFNYLIEKLSLNAFYKLASDSTAKENEPYEPAASRKKEDKAKKLYIETEDFKNFARTLENLLNQHNEERQNFLRLINTLQEKIFVLENQLNLLKGPVQKRWYEFWR